MAVADFIDVAEGADVGGGEGEAVAVVGLGGSAGVADGLGAGTDAELSANFVLYDAADLAGEVEFHC